MTIITTLILTLIFLPTTLVGAQGYIPLVGIPGVADPDADFNSYITALYVLSISIAALLAVIRIVIAGIKWMMTDIAPAKSEAKKDIQGALVGLVVVLAAVLILTVINPDITNVDLSLSGVGTTAVGQTEAKPPTIYNESLWGPYKAIVFADYEYPDIYKWEKECKQAGNQSEIDQGLVKCFTVGPENNAEINHYCSSWNPFTSCTKEKIAAETKAAQDFCTAYNGTLTNDPLSVTKSPDGKTPVSSICVYPK